MHDSAKYRNRLEIEGIYINGYKYLINQYADYTNIFIKYDENSLRQVVHGPRGVTVHPPPPPPGSSRSGIILFRGPIDQ